MRGEGGGGEGEVWGEVCKSLNFHSFLYIVDFHYTIHVPFTQKRGPNTVPVLELLLHLLRDSWLKQCIVCRS